MIKDHGGLSEEEMFRQSEERSGELCKANLRYEAGESGEGIWVLPCTPQDVELAENDDSQEELF